ncbi:class I adenylate-forming enzyme family protein [Micromonospora craniellae]|uniref:Long-chain fatty acid--CoA ligase n=1 Tax=Micromonospora craniellae TaxID=2294034 RepID=A0A372FUR4_9ACTN|nr:class I adenylate-forming enzyme family protein [Micromonospora craniellae]QOC92211.1 acyl--CoA ligase [Micromonospora craniellae]RFS44354.1 long-chain fatty acid--CoA ligase [Micromonospora craniellae]
MTNALDATVLDHAAQHPDRPLYAFDQDRPVSAGEFADLAGRRAATLAALDVGRGDRIAVWAENSLDWLVLLAAAAWRGAALVTLHPGLSAPELTTALARSRPRRLFVARHIRDRDGAATAAQALGALPASARPYGWHILGDNLAGIGDGTAPAPAGHPDATLNIQFTSGSTGPAKMVALSARNLIANARWTADTAGLRAADRIASPLPLAHAAGLGSGAVLALVTGALWVSVSRFRSEPVLTQIARHRCTVLQAVPTMATMLADTVETAPDRFDLSSLRVGFLGGAPCPPALLARTRRVLGLDRIAVIYGQTEAGPTISVDPGDGSCGSPGDTVGRIVADLGAVVVTPGTRTELPAGQPGELLVRGESVTAGYVDDPTATEAAITTDGWLRTGDLGALDTDRILTLTGRVKELIIRGGENISPAEVEAALLDDPAVAQVCVLGLPSPRWGEEVAALVVAAPGTEPDHDRLTGTAATRLARHKVPTLIRTVGDLPLLPSGKVDRRAALALLTGEERR